MASVYGDVYGSCSGSTPSPAPPSGSYPFGLDEPVVAAESPVIIDLPATGEPQDLALGDDLDVVIAAATSASSRLLVSLRRCVNSSTPDVELDNDTGLLQVAGVDAPTPAAGVVTWAADSVTVHIDAEAFKALRIGEYTLSLEELTLGGRRLLKHSRTILLYRSGGGLRSTV